jgi:hypothetical protein
VHRIEVNNKQQIKQLLYSGCILAIKGSQFHSYGGFQMWWYDKKTDMCHIAESHWMDRRKQVKTCRFAKGVKTLWHNKRSLYLSTKHVTQYNKSGIFRILGISNLGNNRGGQ